jgi:polyisoprenoid-binding protein YceI
MLIGLAFGSAPASAARWTTDVTYSPIAAGRYDLDVNHGIIGFGVRHLGINLVEGRFKDFKGVVTYDDKDVTKSSVEFTAKIASVDTGVAPRDAHLRTADFFDAEKFPDMTFRSTKIEKKGSGYLMTGDLMIKGVTKQVTFPFTLTGSIADPWGGTRFGIEGSTVLNRRDFGINFGSLLPSGALDVANEVNVALHIEAVKAK